MSFNPTLDISGLGATKKKTTPQSTTASTATPSSSQPAHSAFAVPRQPASQSPVVQQQPPAATTATVTATVTAAQNASEEQPPASFATAQAVATPKIPTSVVNSIVAPSSSAVTATQQQRPSPDRVPLFLPGGKDTDEEEGYLSSDLSEVDQLASDGDDAQQQKKIAKQKKHKKQQQPVASTSSAPASASAPKAVPSTSASASKPKNRPSAPASTPAPAASSSSSRGSSRIPPLPHFTVVRSTGKNTRDTPHKIIINPGVTDGDKSRWRRDTTRGLKVDGKLNWHEVQPITGKQHNNFRIGLGKSLAEKLHLFAPGSDGKDEHWVLDNWPDNYQFTVHHTPGKSEGSDRTDTYVYGSAAAPKFRTVNELTPHLHWLLIHGPTDNHRCSCKYCSKKKQSEVNSIEGLQSGPFGHTGSQTGGSKRASSVASSSTPNGGPAKKKLKYDDYEIPDENTGFLADKTRNAVKNKVRQASAATSSTSTTTARQKREEKEERKRRKKKQATPTYSGSFVNKDRDVDLSDGPLYRVGELVWVELPSPLVSRSDNRMQVDTDGPSSEPERITHWIGLIAERSIRSLSVRTSPLLPGQPPSISNSQTFSYRCKLLALDSELTRDEAHIRAWLTHGQPDGLLTVDRMTAQESVELAWNEQEKECRKPKLEQLEGQLEKAVTAFALASQMAAHVVAYFSLVDRYKIDASHIISSASMPASDQIKRDAIIARSFHYQCIWWGGERIWTGELVRIITDKATVDSPELLPASKGANKRAMFLRLAAVYKDPESEQALLSGQLYELRDLAEGDLLVDGSPVEKDEVVTGLVDPHMPPPPPGFVFRRRTRAGESVQLDAEYLAGRYYQLPLEWRSRETIDRILSTVEDPEEIDMSDIGDEQGNTNEMRAVVVAGLVNARVLYMNCATWRSDRHTSIVEAESKAQGEMASWFIENSSSSSRDSEHSPSAASDSNSNSNPNDAAAPDTATATVGAPSLSGPDSA